MIAGMWPLKERMVNYSDAKNNMKDIKGISIAY